MKDPIATERTDRRPSAPAASLQRRGLRRLSPLAMLLALLATGCVERRMTIRSEPRGALVVLDGQEIGHTPVSVPFTYYGDRQIKLIKDGYETKTINQTISAPVYQYIPIDFVSEVLVPWRIRDERNYVYTLEAATMVSTDQLLERAGMVREQGQNPPAEALRKAGLLDNDAQTVLPQE